MNPKQIDFIYSESRKLDVSVRKTTGRQPVCPFHLAEVIADLTVTKYMSKSKFENRTFPNSKLEHFQN